jgi:hypothetical protein
MAEQREFVDKFTENRCDFMGRMSEDPQFFDVSGGQGALLKLKTTVPEIGANGQWTDKIHIIPIYVMDPVKTEKVVKPYVKSGKQLKLGASVKVWDDGTLGLVATFIKLGSNPFKPKTEEAAPLPG